MRRGNRIIANSRFQALMVCVCSALGLFWGHCANALEYTEATWGFDGRVVPDQFNLLTVVVHNPAQMPFEGVVRLEQAQGFAKWGGTEIKPCYLDPGGSRTLQFYPRITGMNGWRLSDGIHTEDLDAPKHGIPALVRLVDGDDPLQVNHQIKAFPHQRFPTTVGGTSGLYALVVDDVPKFAPSQKAAFVDWVMAGGRLHVFMNRDGEFPDFDSPMLAIPEASLPGTGRSHQQIVGNGVVNWYARPVSSLSSQEVSSLEPVEPSEDDKNYHVPIDMQLFQQLQNLTHLNVAWPLVYLAAITYVGLLGPGHYFWVRRKKRDYRIVLGVLLGTVAVFGGLFALIGRRGYGERTQSSTVSIARHIEGSRYDVTSWGNVFVTDGDDYEFRHESTHNLYSTGESYESVNATTTSGREGAMQTEIPVFSSRTFVHQGTLNGINRPQLLSDVGNGKRRSIVWQLPETAVVNGAWVRMEGSVFVAEWDASRRHINFSIAGGRLYNPQDSNHFNSTEADSIQLSNTGRNLLNRTLGLIEYQKPKWVPPLDEGTIELFLLTPTPESFFLTGEAFAIQQGATLYRYLYRSTQNSKVPSTP